MNELIPNQHNIIQNDDSNPYPSLEENENPQQSLPKCSFCKNDLSNNSFPCSFLIYKNIIQSCQVKYCSIDCLLKDYSHHQHHYKEIYHHFKSYKKQTTGIINEGNTCFINSMIQQLSNMFFISIYYQHEYYKPHLKKKGQLSDDFSNTMKLLRNEENNDNTIIDIKKLFNTITTFFPEYAKKEQHDSNEFLMYFVDKLKSELKNESELQKLIYGEYKSTISTENIKTKEKKVQIKSERFVLLFLPIIIKEYIYCFNVDQKEFHKYNVFSNNLKIKVSDLFDKLHSSYGKDKDKLLVYRIPENKGFNFFLLGENDYVYLYSDNNTSDGCKYVIYEFNESVQSIIKKRDNSQKTKEVNNNEIVGNNDKNISERKIIVFVLLKQKSNKFLNIFSNDYYITQYPFCFLENENTLLTTVREKLIKLLVSLGEKESIILSPDTIMKNNIEEKLTVEMGKLSLKNVLYGSQTTCILSYLCNKENVKHLLKNKVFYEDTRGKNTVLLEECLSQFFSKKLIKSKNKSKDIISYSQYSLQKLPFYLLIYLQRDKSLLGKSIDCKYPKVLDIHKHVEKDIIDNLEKKQILYELIGVNQHGGFTKFRGHYICRLFIDKDNSWYEFSDKSVYSCTHIQSTDAISLVYRQKIEGIEYEKSDI